MGYNTAMMVLNDRLHEIKNDPDFGQKVYDAVCMSSAPECRQPYVPQVQVLKSEHADVAQVIVVAGNKMHLLGYGYWKDDNEMLLQKLASDYGFRLVKKAN